MTEQRRLAAILVADVVGYSKLVGGDEAGTLAQLQALRTSIIEPAISKHAGRLFKSVGDGFLVEFASAVQAVEAARAIQQANAEGTLPLRIGVHVGDVVVQGDDLMGDGINVAARIEAVADAGGIALSRQVYDQVRDRLDIAFLDKGEVELRNIARPVHVFTVAATGSATSAVAPALALPDKPSVAVLPFENMSGDPEQEYFADGMVEDIITALSRFRSLFVIARNSTFTYKAKAVDIRQVARDLGVRYVLEGSVRRSGKRIRVTAQLIDTSNSAHLWAERYDRVVEDVFDVQEEITRSIVAAVAPEIENAEIAGMRRSRPGDFRAYEIAMRSWSEATAADAAGNREKRNHSLALADEALQKDPACVLALVAKAFAHFQHAFYGTGELEKSLELAREAATSATRIDHLDHRAHAYMAMGHLAAGDFDGALAEARYAHDLKLQVYWTTKCGDCSLKPQYTTSKERRIKRWEHEAVIDAMQERLDRTPHAMRIRRATVEHAFGTLKAWMGATHFRTRTLEKVKTEMSLYVLAYNLKRVIAILGPQPLMQAMRA